MTGILPIALAVTGALAAAIAVFAMLAPGPAVSTETARPEVDIDVYEELAKRRPPEPRRPAQIVLADTARAALQATVGRKLERSNRGTRLAIELARADVKLKPAEWLLAVTGLCVVGGLLAFARFGSPLAFPFGVLACYVASRVFLSIRQGQRRKRFDSQLAPVIIAISNGLKAGHAFGQALDLAGKNAGEPMAHELARVVREVQLGVPMADALARMVTRNHSEDLRLVMTAVQIQGQVGGNLAQVLDNIEFTIRERIRIKGEVKTLTSQARASGWILMLLPFALAGFLMMSAPTYFEPMLTEGLGRIMLGIAGFSLLCGYAVIRKIVNVKV
jgi:tight adherence protein B